ncbi:MAG: DUF1385 domain-containing protein [Polyangiales bacterium]
MAANVGGQAVIEGVMMRSPRCLTVAVRRKSNEIVLRAQPWRSVVPEALRKIPLVRGALVLVESMQNGYAALRFSAQEYEADLPEEERGSTGAEDSSAQRLGTVFSILLLVGLPKILAWATGRLTGGELNMADPRFHILAGFFKLAIVIGMMLLMRRNAEMYRVFQYHGAEHKAIAVHEAGLPLTVESARRFTTRHARCGTTFLMVVVIVSVAIFALVLPMVLPHNGGLLNVLASIAVSVPLMFPIAGFAYELQRLGARYADHPIAQVFLAPGYLVQRITTAEPTDDQVEIALVALQSALENERALAPSSQPEVEPVVTRYPDFASFATAHGAL